MPARISSLWFDFQLSPILTRLNVSRDNVAQIENAHVVYTIYVRRTLSECTDRRHVQFARLIGMGRAMWENEQSRRRTAIAKARGGAQINQLQQALERTIKKRLDRHLKWSLKKTSSYLMSRGQSGAEKTWSSIRVRHDHFRSVAHQAGVDNARVPAGTGCSVHIAGKMGDPTRLFACFSEPAKPKPRYCGL